ncbi:MAG: tRNA pseudouridine(13) synthase TruD [Planctomycetaceae bacterium]
MTDLPTSVLNPPRSYQPVLPQVVLRAECADFDVEEIPAYMPNGSGEHLYLWIEKTDVSAADLLTRLASQLALSTRDIGVAGQKDRRAVTRQFVSVPGSCESQLGRFSDDKVRILSVTSHGNKLRTGHLNGNRFRIVLRSPNDEPFTAEQAADTAQRLELLSVQGFANVFGPQRFGHGGRTAIDGIAFVKGEIKAGRWKHQQRRFMTKMVASAVQSAVFNLCLANRISNGNFTQPMSGDVVCRRDGIRPFLFDERGQTPADTLVPMGPLPGPRMTAAAGCVQDAEIAALHNLNLTVDDFQRYPKLTPGARRRYVEYTSHTSAERLPDGAICIRFELPAGTFATTVIAEIAAGEITTGEPSPNPATP